MKIRALRTAVRASDKVPLTRHTVSGRPCVVIFKTTTLVFDFEGPMRVHRIVLFDFEGPMRVHRIALNVSDKQIRHNVRMGKMGNT